jgi:D-arginine utilization repressor
MVSGKALPSSRKASTVDFSAQGPLIEGIVALLHPHAEVVIHDVATDRIVAIWNSFSGRSVGDESLLSELPNWEPSHGLDPLDSHVRHSIEPQASILGPYEKINVDGHRVVSVSIEIAGGTGLICINLDRHVLDDAIGALQRFAQAIVPQPQMLFERDWREEIHRVVDEWCRQQSVDRSRLSRSQRVELVAVLDDKGLFATRNAASLVGLAFGVSRATVYSLLSEARS